MSLPLRASVPCNLKFNRFDAQPTTANTISCGGHLGPVSRLVSCFAILGTSWSSGSEAKLMAILPVRRKRLSLTPPQAGVQSRVRLTQAAVGVHWGVVFSALDSALGTGPAGTRWASRAAA